MPNGVRCPHCGSSGLHRDGYTDKGAAKYHCLNCGRYFNDLTKTIFEHHKFPYRGAVLHLEGNVVQEYIADINGAREEVRFHIGFRKRGARDCGEDRGKINLRDLIEIDEVYITAGEKGIKQDRPRRRGLRRRGRGTYEGRQTTSADIY